MEARRLARGGCLNHVERHHARHHAGHATESRQQHIDVADSVLQADHSRARRGVLRDQPRHRLRGPALDRDEDDIGLGKRRRRIGRQSHLGRCQHPISAVEIGDAQPVPRNRLGQRGTQEQRHLAPRQGQAAADVAANAAGTGHGDPHGAIRCHRLTPPLRFRPGHAARIGAVAHPRQEAGVYGQENAGDGLGLVRAKEGDGIGDIRRLGQAR